MWDGGGFPHADPYSFTAAGSGWAVQSWLASVLYAGLEDVGGLNLVRLQFAAAIAAIGAIAWALTSRCESTLGRVLAIAPAFVVGVFGWAHRPYLFGLAGLGLLLLALEGRLRPQWLVVVGYVWVNTHGTWPLGLVAVACWWIGRRLDRQTTADITRTLSWFGCGLAAGVVNPYGVRLLLFPASALTRQEVFSQIKEWRAPDFQRPEELAFLLVVALVAVGLKRSGRWTDVVPSTVFVLAGLVSTRNIAFATLVALPTVSSALAGMRLPEPTPLLQRASVAIAAVVALFAAVRITTTPSTDLSIYPIAATRWLEDHGLSPESSRIIAHDFVGNWFEFRYGATGTVFLDDRYEVMSVEAVRHYRTLLDGDEGWREALASYQADAVVWRRGEPLAQLLELDPCWRIPHRDDDFVVAVPAASTARCGT